MNFNVQTRGGFHLTFPNGLIISTQIGPGTYSDNHDASFDCFLSKDRLPDRSSSTAEIAIMYKGECLSEIYDPEAWGVLGYQTMENFIDIFKFVSSLTEAEVAIKVQEAREIIRFRDTHFLHDEVQSDDTIT